MTTAARVVAVKWNNWWTRSKRHIWFETCGDCHGSFFDAGEFRDLSELTVSDFFKRLVTPTRL